jgi:hypothetical protein
MNAKIEPMKSTSDLTRIEELLHEIEQINLILYPNMRKNEESPLTLSLDEWFETDLELTEIQINQQLLKSNLIQVFLHLHSHFILTKSIREIDWRDLLDGMFEMKLHGFTEILPIVENLKSNSPNNWSKEIK